LERNPLPRPFFQRFAIGSDRLLQLFRPVLSLAEPPECEAEGVLRRRPVERKALARVFLQRREIGRDRKLEILRPALPLSELGEREPKIVEGCSPLISAPRQRDLTPRDRNRYLKRKINALVPPVRIELVLPDTDRVKEDPWIAFVLKRSNFLYSPRCGGSVEA
jgi:hypothetical protein